MSVDTESGWIESRQQAGLGQDLGQPDEDFLTVVEGSIPEISYNAAVTYAERDLRGDIAAAERVADAADVLVDGKPVEAQQGWKAEARARAQALQVQLNDLLAGKPEGAITHVNARLIRNLGKLTAPGVNRDAPDTRFTVGIVRSQIQAVVALRKGPPQQAVQPIQTKA